MVKARKRFGQHFLEPAWVAKLVAAIEPEPDDPFVEIGPGKGAITLPLLQHSGRVLAIEVDRDLAAHLRERYADRANVLVVEADVLTVDLGALADGDYVLAGNVPYYITTFYAVVDPSRGLLRFANAGHPHAFLMREDGTVERLGASTPPLGMIDDPPATESRPWQAGRDLLLLFTDGISDAVDRAGRRLGEEPVIEAVRAVRDRTEDEIVQAVFAQLEIYQGGARPLDDLTLVILRS